ncbi:MAG: DUF302 domain-containing protein [Candidatus Thermoplasmatota archaeon]|jgi:uncharacterized protein (DUF302 family)|nr:DUF302 domain-containing protein [Candidatus Thermoplasmatota archaeon]MCL5790812.1 DUF302 domain-containing protein [Candidatus Thermoplasmatota archaeon]
MNTKEIVSKFGFEETVGILQRSVEENGLKVISVIDAQANLKKIGIEIKGNKILEVFHPKLAREVFDSDLRAGIVPPLRIYIYEGNGMTHVSVQSAAELFSRYNGLGELAERVDKMLDSITDSVAK